MAAAVDADEAGARRGGIGAGEAAVDRGAGLAVGRGIDDGQRRADAGQLAGQIGRRQVVHRAADDVGIAVPAADFGRAERGHQIGRTAGCPPGDADDVGERRRKLGAVPPNRPAGCGYMSTTISRPTSSGRRAAIIIASVPPIEWPTIAGRTRLAVGDIAGDLVGERGDHRPGAIAARRLAGEAGDLDQVIAIAGQRSGGGPPDVAARGQARNQDHVRPAPDHLDREAGRLEALRGGGRADQSKREAGEKERAAVHLLSLSWTSLNAALPWFRASAMPSPHLYLVDGSSYIFRAFHRLPPLTNKHGLNVGAVYGYTTMLWKLADSLDKADGPTHLAVILDASESTFRNQMYDQYKANRPPPPPELVPQFPLIRDATRAFSIPCLEEEGLEADDIIACYAKAALAEGWQVTIVSSDKDLMQLIEPGLDMLDTMNDRRIGREEVIEKFGVPPEQVGEVLALMGDSVDNVPGVPGIGPKTASKLIQEFGDVEAVLAAAPEMKPSKMRDNLIEHADKARLSRKLVELICDSPLPEPLDTLEIKGIPRSAAARIPRGSRLQVAARPARRPLAGQRRVAEPADPGRGAARAEDRPLALRDGDRRGGARPLDRRGLRQGPGRVRHRDRRARLRLGQTGRDQPRHRLQQGLLHPARTWRRRHVRRAARPACPPSWCSAS